jgi:excinuclease ABC subunit C
MTEPFTGATTGHELIVQVVATLPLSPGVYRMLNAKGEALYVGKARSLKKRVTYYTDPARLPERLRRMVFETASMEIVTTPTEPEALLLEANLIKRFMPRYNILLKDDKSFPWLILTEDHPFPQIAKHRGARVRKASYFGPFASAWAVNQSITALERLFQLRSCEDSYFAARTRPCLLHQIKRCSAPCVGRISAADYAQRVREARTFLAGRGAELQKQLASEMETAAEALEFERAAILRDRIQALTHVQTSGIATAAGFDDADVIAIHQLAGQSAVQVFFIRAGRNNGNRAFYPAHSKDAEPAEILSAFIPQFYADKPAPRQILLNLDIPDRALIAEALTLKSGHKIELAVPARGEKRAFVLHAETNAREALERKLAEATGQARLLAAVADLFQLPASPARIEVYDNSHLSGQQAYGAMIVAGPEGFRRNAYRKFSIKGPVTPGDDFAMMKEVLTRRFARSIKEEEQGAEPEWPDLVMIDGGQGQLSAVKEIFDELGLDDIALVAISKGPDRDAGREWFHRTGKPAFQLPPRDPTLYYLQRLRDEVHRFVIGTHRAARSKVLTGSELDGVPGIGPARKRALLNHFGSPRGIKQAGLQDLENTPGINKATAKLVYQYFQSK